MSDNASTIPNPSPEIPTLRDFFAAAALTGFASRAVGISMEERADWAYAQADAMMAARCEKPLDTMQAICDPMGVTRENPSHESGKP